MPGSGPCLSLSCPSSGTPLRSSCSVRRGRAVGRTGGGRASCSGRTVLSSFPEPSPVAAGGRSVAGGVCGCWPRGPGACGGSACGGRGPAVASLRDGGRTAVRVTCELTSPAPGGRAAAEPVTTKLVLLGCSPGSLPFETALPRGGLPPRVHAGLSRAGPLFLTLTCQRHASSLVSATYRPPSSGRDGAWCAAERAAVTGAGGAPGPSPALGAVGEQ